MAPTIQGPEPHGGTGPRARRDSVAIRGFVGIDLGSKCVPDETTIGKFRHWLERHKLGKTLFKAVNEYLGRRTAMRAVAPRARDFTNQRYRWESRVDAVIRAKNRTKSRVHAKIEHSIGVIKRVFGFQKVRYRGLAKNLHRPEVTAALANLFIVRRQLLNA